MSLCPVPLCPADTQAGYLGSAVQSVQVSGGLESLGEVQALTRVSGYLGEDCFLRTYRKPP